MQEKKEQKQPEHALAKKPERKMAWGGVMPRPTGQQDQAIVVFCNQVALVYGVPSMGVNAMGNQPYLNKDGRLYLLGELRKGARAVKAIRKEFVQLSTALDVPAIVKATLVFKDGVEVEAIGEASKDNVKLDAVKKTLNMMAETRAVNRAIWQAIAQDVWNRVATNLAKVKDLSDEEKTRIQEAGRVSYEEMQGNHQKDGGFDVAEDNLIADLKEKVDAVTDTDTLADYQTKLAKGKSSERVKAEVGAYIKKRFEELTK